MVICYFWARVEQNIMVESKEAHPMTDRKQREKEEGAGH
jgi:hypothetical protein